MRSHVGTSGGFSLAELMMGLVVFILTVVVLGNHISVNYNTTKAQRDKVFAFTKAQAILSEIHALVDRGGVAAAVDLDVLDDGVINKPSLTITEDSANMLLLPDHPVSGNISRSGAWVWSRRISVKPFVGLNNRGVRYVTVRIFKRDLSGVPHELASLSSVVNSVGSAFPTTQVFDVYLLAVENIPGWWVYMESIIPFVESSITDLENRNPGLSLRTHWITKAGYGRNQAYRPYINDAVDSNQLVPDVYYYPGRMPAGEASTFYYVPDLIHGRIAVDGVEQHGYDANLNRFPYALADFYNHAMRYPRAREFHDARVQDVVARKNAIAAAVAGAMVPPPELDDMSEEPTLQMFLEDLNTDPDKFRHSLIINVHGELLPVPALRNYSDAAKDPVGLPFVRVVTHPEELRTQKPPAAGVTDVRLRVYAYTTSPLIYPGPTVMPAARPIALQIMDVDLTDGAPNTLFPGVRVQNIRGGVPVGGTLNYSPLSDSKIVGDGTLAANEMYFESEFVDPGAGQRKYTLLKLYHTPVVAPAVNHTLTGQRHGLNNTVRARLYGLEYVPSCAQGTDFNVDLASDGVPTGPKNTARWVITLPNTLFSQARFVDLTSPPTYFDPNTTPSPDQLLTVRTRIWDPNPVDQLGNPAQPLETGTWPRGAETRIVQPDNFSETYTWWAETRDAVPITERSQFNGDPRHNPYRDLLAGDPDFGDGYNWFFDDFVDGAEDARPDFPGIVRLFSRWNNEMRQDVPRYFQLLREGIANTRSIWTTLTGYSYYYMGLGNEIGYDGANGYPSSIPTNLHPWGYGAAALGNINNITGRTLAFQYGRTYIRSRRAFYWWGMPWLGELYDDFAYATDYFQPDAQGRIRGNMKATVTIDGYLRYPDWASHDFSVHRAYGYDQGAGNFARQRTSTRGCVSLFNNSNGGGHFNHHFDTGNANLVGPGIELANNYGFPLPATTQVNRPFSVNTSGNDPMERNFAPYNMLRHSARILRSYYDHPTAGRIGSGLVELENPTSTDAGYIIVNGLSQTLTTGTATIAKFCLLSMLQSFFESGMVGMTYRIKQPPRCELLSPTDITELLDPASIDIQFSTTWVRWDGQDYTASAPSVQENEAEIEYAIMYSLDNGMSWRHVQDDSLAIIGEKPTNPALLVPDQGAGDETYTWPTPAATFTEGSYLLRVEAYRVNQALHYSQHMSRIYIER